MDKLKAKNEGREIPYRPKVAVQILEWLDKAQKKWNLDFTTDIDNLLETLENDADEYKKQQEAKKAELEKKLEKQDAEWCVVDRPHDGEWEML